MQDVGTTWLLIVLIFITYFLLTFLTQEYIYVESIYYKSYSNIVANSSIEDILRLQSRYWWVGYLAIPLVLFLKFTLTSLSINIGAVISKSDIGFKEIFRTIILAEGVFIFAQIFYLMSLFRNLDDITLQNVSSYFPLSAISLIGLENVNAQWAIYPLQTANLFEVFYVIVIALLLSKKWKYDFFETINIVIPSYGLGLLLWVTLVAFLTYQIS